MSAETMQARRSSGGVDLRRTDAHPDYWYPIAWSRELRPGRMLARRYAGEPVAVVRGQDGRLFALENRCAHRQVPLTHGVVRGCTVKCGYHGWAYNADGDCIDVPYLGPERLPNGVRAYPCREVDGLIFVFPGNAILAEARLPPSLGARAERGYKTRELNREVAAHYTFMHENLFDMNHQFLHRRQMGTIKAKCLGRRHGADWAEVDYTFSRTDGASTIGEGAIVGLMRKQGDGDNTDLMTIRTEYPYQHLRVWVGDGEPVLSVWLGYTPLDAEQRTNRTFGYLSVKRPKIPGLLEAAWPFVTLFTENIFKEDKEIVEMEQVAHDAQGGDWNNEVFPPIRDLRALLLRCGVSHPDEGDCP
ncbi:MAG TPA: aromatic ring-hydroxylating dioxygenase subunit alpha [Phenylobacterium sp.]|jgi:phenylpropionate dioxygenase-like ring-hydroxylating dioxygenase large terminal subunit|nr:aromatic ring-hydroxylating dioxygenase subunit alpha [Phenylobacterium sp.]